MINYTLVGFLLFTFTMGILIVSATISAQNNLPDNCKKSNLNIDITSSNEIDHTQGYSIIPILETSLVKNALFSIINKWTKVKIDSIHFVVNLRIVN